MSEIGRNFTQAYHQKIPLKENYKDALDQQIRDNLKRISQAKEHERRLAIAHQQAQMFQSPFGRENSIHPSNRSHPANASLGTLPSFSQGRIPFSESHLKDLKVSQSLNEGEIFAKSIGVQTNFEAFVHALPLLAHSYSFGLLNNEKRKRNEETTNWARREANWDANKLHEEIRGSSNEKDLSPKKSREDKGSSDKVKEDETRSRNDGERVSYLEKESTMNRRYNREEDNESSQMAKMRNIFNQSTYRMEFGNKSSLFGQNEGRKMGQGFKGNGQKPQNPEINELEMINSKKEKEIAHYKALLSQMEENQLKREQQQKKRHLERLEERFKRAEIEANAQKQYEVAYNSALAKEQMPQEHMKPNQQESIEKKFEMQLEEERLRLAERSRQIMDMEDKKQKGPNRKSTQSDNSQKDKNNENGLLSGPEMQKTAKLVIESEMEKIKSEMSKETHSLMQDFQRLKKYTTQTNEQAERSAEEVKRLSEKLKNQTILDEVRHKELELFVMRDFEKGKKMEEMIRSTGTSSENWERFSVPFKKPNEDIFPSAEVKEQAKKPKKEFENEDRKALAIPNDSIPNIPDGIYENQLENVVLAGRVPGDIFGTNQDTIKKKPRLRGPLKDFELENFLKSYGVK